MKIKNIICYGMYKYIAFHLPKSSNSADGFFEKIRALLVRGYIEYSGNELNIQRNATIARRVKIGDYSGVGQKCVIQSNVSIGKHVMMGPEVLIYTQNHDFARTDIEMDKQGFRKEKPVIIDDDVWIGARAIILPGVRIGTGSIIGAGSVVTHNVPPYSVAAGNPAKVVKTRNVNGAENE